MMPNPGGPPMGPMQGGAGAPTMEEKADPQMIKGQIVKMLQEARRVAEESGLMWEEVLAEVSGQKPASSKAPMMPAGGPPPVPGM